MNIISDKRLLINAVINGKEEVFLLDTGASVGLIDRKYLGLKKGKRFNGTLVGAGGSIKATHMCDTPIEIDGRLVYQFIMADISGVQDSIEEETGYRIVGIISLPLMKAIGLTINLAKGEVGI